MNRSNYLLVQVTLLFCLVLAPTVDVNARDIPVYKGMLRVLSMAEREGNTLLLQYRTRTREVLRVRAHRVVVINNRTRRAMRLPDTSADLARGHVAGYLHADMEYNHLDLAGDDYRVEGSLTVYLATGQQTRNFRAYLKPDTAERPANSSIDWGGGEPGR